MKATKDYRLKPLWFRGMVLGFIQIGEGIVTIASLGHYFPQWWMSFFMWEMKRGSYER